MMSATSTVQTKPSSSASRHFLMHLIAYIVVVGILVFLFHAEARTGNRYGIRRDQVSPAPISSDWCLQNGIRVACPSYNNPLPLPITPVLPSFLDLPAPQLNLAQPYRLYIPLPDGSVRHWLSLPTDRQVAGFDTNPYDVAMDAAAMFSWVTALFWGALLASHYFKSWINNESRTVGNTASFEVTHFLRHVVLFFGIGLALLIINFDIRFHDVLTIIINRYASNDPAPIINVVTKFPWSAVFVGAWFILLAIHCIAILDDWRVVMAQTQAISAKEVKPKAS